MRRPRLELPGVPLHIIHRGVNRGATFVDDEDRTRYLQALRTAAHDQSVAIHGYVLMTNHVHRLVGAEVKGAVSRMMQAVGRRYVRPFNSKYGRTGTLWEGRYKSCLVDSDGYLLTCLRYIELNPVRASMARWPWQHRWSSVHAHLGLRPDSGITPHPLYLALGSGATSRAAAYRALLLEPLDDDVLAAVRDHLRQERALGSPCFQARVEAALKRPVRIRPVGRPRVVEVADSSANVL